MRTIIRICGLILAFLALTAPVTQAATITRFIVSGTSANLNLVASVPGSRPDCKVDLWVVLTASSSVQRSNGTTAPSTGAIGFVQRMDHCSEGLEFGSFNATLPASAFNAGNGTVAFNATIPVAMVDQGPAGGTVNRTLVATLRFTNVENNSVASRSFGRVSAPGLVLITRSRSIYNAASIGGQLTLDGKNLVSAQTSSDGSIETGTSATIDITK